MSLTTAVLTGTVLTETVHARSSPMEPLVYGARRDRRLRRPRLRHVRRYRDVANRHRAKAEAYAARHGAERARRSLSGRSRDDGRHRAGHASA